MIVVDVAHEVLLNSWPLLRDWIENNREFKVWRDSLQAEVEKWRNNNQKESWLLRGARLLEAKKQCKKRASELTDDEKNYIKASIELRKREIAERRQARREREALRQRQIEALKKEEQAQRRSKRVFFIGLIVAVGLALLAVWQSWESEKAKNETQISQSRFLADLALQEIEQGNAVNGVLLALEALPKNMSNPNRPYVREAEERLYKAILNLHESLVLQGHQGKIKQLFFNKYGTQIAILNEEGNVYLWDVTIGKLLNVLLGYNVNSTTFNPEIFPFLNTAFYEDKDKTSLSGFETSFSVKPELLPYEIIGDINRCGPPTIVTTTLFDSIVRLREASYGKLIHELSGHTNMVRMAAFSPNGEFVVTASEDNTVRLWDSSTGEMLHILSGHTDGVSYVTFYGPRLVTVSDDNTLRLWKFNPNKLTMETDSSDKKNSPVRIFSTQELIDYANKVVPRCLTPEQRQQFFLPPSQSHALIKEGEKLAQSGKIEAAISQFKKAKELEPCHKFFSEDKARHIAAQARINKGKELAEKKQIDEAIAELKKAQKIDPRFKFDPENYARRLAKKL